MNLGPYTYGQIDDPNSPCRLIKIHSRIQCPKRLIETVVHELLHGAEWEVEESWVTRVAREVSHALFVMGARIDANSMPIIDEPETWQ